MFKNITLVFLCAFCIGFTVKAQTTIDEDTLFADGYVGASNSDYIDLSAHTKIRNTSSEPDTFVWTRIVETLPTTNWTSAVCDIILCHGVTTSTAEFIMPPNIVKELSFHFYPKVDKGVGHMVVRFAKKSNPTIYTDVYINCQAYGLGVHSIYNSTLKIFPNPAVNSITVSNDKIKEGTYEIFNLLGETVLADSFIGSQEINVSTLSKGIYFITVKGANSTATNKLVIE